MSVMVRPAAVVLLRKDCCHGALPQMCEKPLVVAWVSGPPYFTPTQMCRECLNRWLDRADDKPSLEPYELRWLAAS